MRFGYFDSPGISISIKTAKKAEWKQERSKRCEGGGRSGNETWLSPSRWPARGPRGWRGGETEGRYRWSGRLGCAGSYWQSCSGIHTALYAPPPREWRIWSSPAAVAGSDWSSSVRGFLHSKLPLRDGSHRKAAEDERHVQTNLLYVFGGKTNHFHTQLCNVTNRSLLDRDRYSRKLSKYKGRNNERLGISKILPNICFLLNEKVHLHKTVKSLWSPNSEHQTPKY